MFPTRSIMRRCTLDLNNNRILSKKRREGKRERKNSPSIVRTKVFSTHIFSPRSLINEHLYRTNVLSGRRRKEGKGGGRKEDAPEKRETTCAILGVLDARIKGGKATTCVREIHLTIGSAPLIRLASPPSTASKRSTIMESAPFLSALVHPRTSLLV